MIDITVTGRWLSDLLPFDMAKLAVHHYKASTNFQVLTVSLRKQPPPVYRIQTIYCGHGPELSISNLKCLKGFRLLKASLRFLWRN